MTFVLKDETKSFGSRVAGASVKRQIANLLTMRPGTKLNIDLSGVPIVSSSFADEVFGRLFHKLGPLQFMAFVEIQNADRTVLSLIDRAIRQRMQNGSKTVDD